MGDNTPTPYYQPTVSPSPVPTTPFVTPSASNVPSVPGSGSSNRNVAGFSATETPSGEPVPSIAPIREGGDVPLLPSTAALAQAAENADLAAVDPVLASASATARQLEDTLTFFTLDSDPMDPYIASGKAIAKIATGSYRTEPERQQLKLNREALTVAMNLEEFGVATVPALLRRRLRHYERDMAMTTKGEISAAAITPSAFLNKVLSVAGADPKTMLAFNDVLTLNYDAKINNEIWGMPRWQRIRDRLAANFVFLNEAPPPSTLTARVHNNVHDLSKLFVKELKTQRDVKMTKPLEDIVLGSSSVTRAMDTVLEAVTDTSAATTPDPEQLDAALTVLKTHVSNVEAKYAGQALASTEAIALGAVKVLIEEGRDMKKTVEEIRKSAQEAQQWMDTYASREIDNANIKTNKATASLYKSMGAAFGVGAALTAITGTVIGLVSKGRAKKGGAGAAPAPDFDKKIEVVNFAKDFMGASAALTVTSEFIARYGDPCNPPLGGFGSEFAEDWLLRAQHMEAVTEYYMALLKLLDMPELNNPAPTTTQPALSPEAEALKSVGGRLPPPQTVYALVIDIKDMYNRYYDQMPTNAGVAKTTYLIMQCSMDSKFLQGVLAAYGGRKLARDDKHLLRAALNKVLEVKAFYSNTFMEAALDKMGVKNEDERAMYLEILAPISANLRKLQRDAMAACEPTIQVMEAAIVNSVAGLKIAETHQGLNQKQHNLTAIISHTAVEIFSNSVSGRFSLQAIPAVALADATGAGAGSAAAIAIEDADGSAVVAAVDAVIEAQQKKMECVTTLSLAAMAASEQEAAHMQRAATEVLATASQVISSAADTEENGTVRDLRARLESAARQLEEATSHRVSDDALTALRESVASAKNVELVLRANRTFEGVINSTINVDPDYNRVKSGGGTAAFVSTQTRLNAGELKYLLEVVESYGDDALQEIKRMYTNSTPVLDMYTYLNALPNAADRPPLKTKDAAQVEQAQAIQRQREAIHRSTTLYDTSVLTTTGTSKLRTPTALAQYCLLSGNILEGALLPFTFNSLIMMQRPQFTASITAQFLASMQEMSPITRRPETLWLATTIDRPEEIRALAVDTLRKNMEKRDYQSVVFLKTFYDDKSKELASRHYNASQSLFAIRPNVDTLKSATATVTNQDVEKFVVCLRGYAMHRAVLLFFSDAEKDAAGEDGGESELLSQVEQSKLLGDVKTATTFSDEDADKPAADKNKTVIIEGMSNILATYINIATRELNARLASEQDSIENTLAWSVWDYVWNKTCAETFRRDTQVGIPDVTKIFNVNKGITVEWLRERFTDDIATSNQSKLELQSPAMELLQEAIRHVQTAFLDERKLPAVSTESMQNIAGLCMQCFAICSTAFGLRHQSILPPEIIMMAFAMFPPTGMLTYTIKESQLAFAAGLTIKKHLCFDLFTNHTKTCELIFSSVFVSAAVPNPNNLWIQFINRSRSVMLAALEVPKRKFEQNVLHASIGIPLQKSTEKLGLLVNGLALSGFFTTTPKIVENERPLNELNADQFKRLANNVLGFMMVLDPSKLPAQKELPNVEEISYAFKAYLKDDNRAFLFNMVTEDEVTKMVQIAKEKLQTSGRTKVVVITPTKIGFIPLNPARIKQFRQFKKMGIQLRINQFMQETDPADPLYAYLSNDNPVPEVEESSSAAEATPAVSLLAQLANRPAKPKTTEAATDESGPAGAGGPTPAPAAGSVVLSENDQFIAGIQQRLKEFKEAMAAKISDKKKRGETRRTVADADAEREAKNRERVLEAFQHQQEYEASQASARPIKHGGRKDSSILHIKTKWATRQ
jgi:hypothetical protein